MPAWRAAAAGASCPVARIARAGPVPAIATDRRAALVQVNARSTARRRRCCPARPGPGCACPARRPARSTTTAATARAARSISTGPGSPRCAAAASIARISAAVTSRAGRVASGLVATPSAALVVGLRIAGGDDKRNRQVAPVGQADRPAGQVDGGGPLLGPAVQKDQRLAPAVGQDLDFAPADAANAGAQRLRHRLFGREARRQFGQPAPAVALLGGRPDPVQRWLAPALDGRRRCAGSR